MQIIIHYPSDHATGTAGNALFGGGPGGGKTTPFNNGALLRLLNPFPSVLLFLIVAGLIIGTWMLALWYCLPMGTARPLRGELRVAGDGGKTSPLGRMDARNGTGSLLTGKLAGLFKGSCSGTSDVPGEGKGDGDLDREYCNGDDKYNSLVRSGIGEDELRTPELGLALLPGVMGLSVEGVARRALGKVGDDF